jgi:hypothetical protein
MHDIPAEKIAVIFQIRLAYRLLRKQVKPFKPLPVFPCIRKFPAVQSEKPAAVLRGNPLRKKRPDPEYIAPAKSLKNPIWLHIELIHGFFPFSVPAAIISCLPP